MDYVHVWGSKSVKMKLLCMQHATTMKAAWNVNFFEFKDTNTSNTRENGG
jgi:hypothetical protein